MKRMNKRETRDKGITLLALVVVIIILIILSAITINMVFGDNGLTKRAENAKLEYEEASAREQLEIVLAKLVVDKKFEPEYDEQDYINKEIIKNNMQVTGDIVIVDGWQFLIDRSVPQIVSSLGKGINDENIVIEASSKTNSDRSKATITAIIECEEDITEISMNGEMLQVPDKEEGKYTITKEVSKNGIYTMIARSENKYNMKSYEVQDIIPEISKIYTLDDMKAFRESVNLGRSYAGKIVELMNDIDLQGREENQWETIGDYEANTNNGFDGIFEGNNHTISNLYINKPTKKYVGLFSFIKEKAEVKDIIIEGNVTGDYMVGGVVGANLGKIDSCINKVTIRGGDCTGGIARMVCSYIKYYKMY